MSGVFQTVSVLGQTCSWFALLPEFRLRRDPGELYHKSVPGAPIGCTISSAGYWKPVDPLQRVPLDSLIVKPVQACYTLCSADHSRYQKALTSRVTSGYETQGVS
jgi:hypothetical protein